MLANIYCKITNDRLFRFWSNSLCLLSNLNKTTMAYFTDDFVGFFKDLAANNDRDWFNANKKRYENSVKKPFEVFIGDMIKKTQTVEPDLKLEPKEAIFRIYRDTRFSKDKTPYKLQASAIIADGGRKGMHSPGMYLELNPEEVRVYGGMYMPDKELLYSVREQIMNNMAAFDKAINDKGFKKVYGEIQGDKNKVLPKEFKEAAEKQPLIYNKAFYYYTKLPVKLITSPKLPDEVLSAYNAAKPVREFLRKAVK